MCSSVAEWVKETFVENIRLIQFTFLVGSNERLKEKRNTWRHREKLHFGESNKDLKRRSACLQKLRVRIGITAVIKKSFSHSSLQA